MTAIPKPVRFRDPEYLAFVREHYCCVSPDHDKADAHHLDQGGTGSKGSDRLTVPLCRICHCAIHFYGMELFCEKHNLMPWWLWEVSARLQAEWAERRG